ncbi:N-acetylmuramoyl-L-alanine amidase [Filibacter tadaridae]|uniref:Sporulation-specific N-acetylmuramoyl-L-alanine amidase n=1 Tax=Filibacter tadaridae TaxID=2483811 RepID=A0A3P5XFN0_9BACL|nr:N-acetylmuramoyl-L-alanine amidase [Filibacter tadaridae]VDC29028.1 Sporulation-specific N-acetylmuramoyl-L-alanine amidase [Filibacter tadaridae]
MVRIVIDAGHGLHTPGKRSPDNEREWSFNNKVARYAIVKLKTYKDVEILRVDDPTGMTDVPLKTRTDLANKWQADVYASIHHNALSTKWGKHSGIETYTIDNPAANSKSIEIAGEVHPRIVVAMGVSDRGMKQANFHVLRESAMPAILTEGGFMDSTVDIIKLRDERFLKAQGEAIAEGLAAYFKLQPIEIDDSAIPAKKKGDNLYKPSSQSIINTTATVLKRLESKDEGAINLKWRKKLLNGTLTDSDAIGILYEALDRGLLDENK